MSERRNLCLKVGSFDLNGQGQHGRTKHISATIAFNLADSIANKLGYGFGTHRYFMRLKVKFHRTEQQKSAFGRYCCKHPSKADILSKIGNVRKVQTLKGQPSRSLRRRPPAYLAIRQRGCPYFFVSYGLNPLPAGNAVGPLQRIFLRS